jgi:hypothetical protein
MCEYEDSTWCVWLAWTRGNGKGNSFISLWDGAQINMVNGLTFLALLAATFVIWWLASNGKLGRK